MEQHQTTTPTTHSHSHRHHSHPSKPISTSQILQGLNTIIQLHFEKTLEKKRSIDAQKKYLWKLFHLFLIILALVIYTLSQSHSSSKLQCKHCWIPIIFLTLSHLVFYVSVAHTLRSINGFKYQRRCHKLTLCLATEKLRELKGRMMMSSNGGGGGEGIVHEGFELDDEDVREYEIQYQEPDESYFGKFKRNWALHFAFIVFIYAFMISSSIVLLCV